MGRRSRKAYWVEVSKGLRYVFISPPTAPCGIWYLCRPLVLVTSCAVCGSGPGEPCRNKSGGFYSSDIHVLRSEAYERGLKDGSIERPKPPPKPMQTKTRRRLARIAAARDA